MMVDYTSIERFELSPPLDLSHHYSEVTKQRVASKVKQFYKYFAIPGIGNLAGGRSLVLSIQMSSSNAYLCRSS